MGKVNLGDYKKKSTKKSRDTTIDDSRNTIDNTPNILETHPVIDTKKDLENPPENQTPNSTRNTKKTIELHLEELLISDNEIWEKIKPHRSTLKNFLTRNHPHSEICLRSPVLSEIANITNQILAEKLKKTRGI